MKLRVLYVTAIAVLFGLGLALLPPDGTAQEAGEEQAPEVMPVEAPGKSGEQETGTAPEPAAEEAQIILATLGSEPIDYYGPCPAKITFVGTISVTRPCELHYKFVRSDGESSPVKAMNFVTAASREVMTSWQVEKDYFKRTGIFPIMHTVVFRREVYEANPWAAASLYEAFVEAKRWAYNQLMETDALKLTLPWVVAETEETRRVMGEDFWPYGIEANRVSLEALPRFLNEQNLISRVPEIEELFVPNVPDHST